MVQHK